VHTGGPNLSDRIRATLSRLPARRSPSVVRDAAIGVAVAVVALLVKGAIVQIQGNDIGYLTLFAGIPVAALVGGFTAGAVVVVLGAFVDALVFQGAIGSMVVSDPAAAARLALFLPIGLWLAWLVAAVGAARHVAAQSAERFQTVLGGLPDFAVLVDPADGKIEYANRAVETLGWAPDELLGMAIERVIPGTDVLAPDTEGQGLTRTVISPTSTAVPVDVRSARIVLPSGATRHLVTARDATQRIESEVRLVRLAAAERSNVRSLEAVIGAMDEGIAVIGSDDTVTISNAALSGMTGGAVSSRQSLEQAFGSELRDGEFNLTDPDRSIAIRVFDVGEPAGSSTLIVASDVSERRREEAGRDAFMGVLSHELRTPVTTLLGLAEIMARPGYDPIKGNDAGLAADLAAEATRLAQLIEDLLVLSRAQSGRMVIEVEPVLIDRLVHDAVAAEAARHPRITFEVDIEGRLPPVDGDMTYLGQVLRNMIDNAGKYGPPTGVVRIRAFASEGSVVVAVLDEGPGIEPNDASRLFEIFFRSARTAGTRAGSGIGMYVARTLIEAMGGMIWARPGEGGGAEFGFSLPILDAAELDAEWVPPPEERRHTAADTP
jgi:signal transduction histidine kinase